ncbi:MAG: universal stress protein [Desulfosarcinaceae bacterium]
MFKCIVFATDGSESSRKAQEYARELTRLHGAALYVVNVYHNISDLLGYKEQDAIASHRVFQSREFVDKVIRELAAGGVEAESEVLEGPAAEAILRVAEVRNADLIIVGARGRGSLKGLLLGSVTHKIIQYAKCPVLVVRDE